jgi:hypothetical protein
MEQGPKPRMVGLKTTDYVLRATRVPGPYESGS